MDKIAIHGRKFGFIENLRSLIGALVALIRVLALSVG